MTFYSSFKYIPLRSTLKKIDSINIIARFYYVGEKDWRTSNTNNDTLLYFLLLMCQIKEPFSYP